MNYGMLAAVLLGAAQAADAGHGQTVFAQCAACHANPGGGIGPSLHGIVGRPAASLPSFQYSNAMRRAGFTWDEQHLRDFVQDPQSVVPGTRMAFAGLDDPADADDLIAYLKKY